MSCDVGLDQLATRLDLQELVARYSIARDDRDIAGLVDMFTPDGEFHRLSRVVRGREEIRDFFRASMKRHDLTLHTVHVPVFDLLGPDEAAGTVNGHAELVIKSVLHLAAYRYTDRYHRIDGRWLIRRRHLCFLYAVAADQYPTVFRDMRRIRWPGSEPVQADYPETLPSWNSDLAP